MDLNLKNHVAVITGGASGIGRATAELFAAEGARVALWDLSPKTADVAGEIARKFNVATLGITVSVTDEADVQSALAGTERELGPIEHLVHSAAIGSGKFGFPYTNLQPSDWRRTLEVNVMGMVNVAHALGPGMIAREEGTMVFLGSIAGQNGSQTDPPYSAAKAAGINFAICLAKDLAPHNVRVNTVNPGMVKTALNESVWKAWHDQQPAEKRRTYQEWANEKVKAIVPLGRWQEPQDVADLIVFLSSSRARQITGQTMNVDGGYVMR